MLHPVPNSTERERLLLVVEMQRQLVEALCGRANGAVVDQAWLQSAWPAVHADWIRRFWENDKGARAAWIVTIAAASVAEKATLLAMVAEQLRFAELYADPPTLRLTLHTWDTPVMEAVNKLLKSFYDPLFYAGEGFPIPTGDVFHKDQFIDGFFPRVRICPYTDNVIQDTKLDHFLPKDQFPMLSCHPDNLIPCCNDANSGSHKGTQSPLDLAAQDQAKAWFHPRRRSARGTYMLIFPPGSTPQPQIRFRANDPQDQPRLDNMESMFGLNEFWGGILDDEVQMLASAT